MRQEEESSGGGNMDLAFECPLEKHVYVWVGLNLKAFLIQYKWLDWYINRESYDINCNEMAYGRRLKLNKKDFKSKKFYD
jgi:hypothetical protein